MDVCTRATIKRWTSRMRKAAKVAEDDMKKIGDRCGLKWRRCEDEGRQEAMLEEERERDDLQQKTEERKCKMLQVTIG